MGQKPSGPFVLCYLLGFTFNISSFQSELNQPGIFAIFCFIIKVLETSYKCKRLKLPGSFTQLML